MNFANKFIYFNENGHTFLLTQPANANESHYNRLCGLGALPWKIVSIKYWNPGTDALDGFLK